MQRYTASSCGLRVSAAGGPQALVVLLHGFTQTGASWAPLVPYLGPVAVWAPDLPGHGSASGQVVSLWAAAEALSTAVDGPSAWAGYSLGGRSALHVALAHPGKVSRLALVSTSPGIPDEPARLARRQSDEALAQRLESEGVEAFLAWWLAQPLFASLPLAQAGLDARRANTAAGLASSLRTCGAGSQEPLWSRLGDLRRRNTPVLLVAGELDARYCEMAKEMASQLGTCAQVLIVPDCGHACHLERPDIVGPALASFLAA